MQAKCNSALPLLPLHFNAFLNHKKKAQKQYTFKLKAPYKFQLIFRIKLSAK